MAPPSTPRTRRRRDRPNDQHGTTGCKPREKLVSTQAATPAFAPFYLLPRPYRAEHDVQGTACVASGGACVSVGRGAVRLGCVPAIPVDVDEVVIATAAPEAPPHPQKSPNIPHPARIAGRSPSHLHPTPHIRRRTRRAGIPTPLAALGETSGPRLVSSAWRCAHSLRIPREVYSRPEERRYWSSAVCKAVMSAWSS
ncbi:hypothetical protein C8J57DRAFT_1493991 [Mycena rebaudengoi]|nr:hypothetical protein C8J57DRAFT_1493991 [Mycena rebaudengoi]